MKRLILYMVLILILVALPTKSRGQSVELSVDNTKFNSVILNQEGLPLTALWELGRKLRDEDTKATIRHSLSGGNGANIDVNSKMSLHFIVAPSDVKAAHSKNNALLTWAGAMGFDEATNNNRNAKPIQHGLSGCSSYVAATESGAVQINNWRLPTQRELSLMWLFKTTIQQGFVNLRSKFPSLNLNDCVLEGAYWSSTESFDDTACFFNFGSVGVNPKSGTTFKTQELKVRCVADY